MAVRDKDLYRERDEALYKAYKSARNKLLEECIKNGESCSNIHSRAIKMAINTPQPRFWITQDRTYRIIRVLLKGGDCPSTWPTKKTMRKELLDAFYRLRSKRMFKGMSLSFIASFLTFEPASGFFMSYHRALRAIKYLKQQHKRL